MVQFPSSASAQQLILRDERGELARAPLTQGKAQVRMPDQPGLYTLSADDSSKVEKVLSVNPPAKESELTYADAAETMRSWKIDAPTRNISSVSAAQASLSLRGILQQRLWWWMMLGGLMALMLETTLAGTRKERG